MQRQIVVEALGYLCQDMTEVGIPEPITRELLMDAADYLALNATEKTVILERPLPLSQLSQTGIQTRTLEMLSRRET